MTIIASGSKIPKDVEEIFYCSPGIKIRMLPNGKKKWIDLYYEASVHRDHPMMIFTDVDGYTTMSDYGPGPELDAWLEQRPYTIGYQGKRIQINLTKKDMTLFKMFWG